MTSLILDLEANGLLPEADKVWCLCSKELETGRTLEWYPYRQSMLDVIAMLDYIASFDRLIIHNGIDYDLPVLKKVYGFEYEGEVLDTLIQSRMQDPNRKHPRETFQRGIGPHSLEAWGYRVGRGKIAHEDWSQWSMEMVDRCREDVEILHLVHDELMREAQEGGWLDPVRMTCRLFINLKRMEENGFTVDQEQLGRSLRILNVWMARITVALHTYLPVKTVIKETKERGKYKWVKKPFLKNGDYSKVVYNWFGEDVPKGYVNGPFCRIEHRRLSLDKPSEIKEYLLGKGWEPMEWNTNSKGKRTSPKLSKDEKFYGLSDKTGRLAAKYIQCKSRKSILEGWKKSIRPDGKISPLVTGLTVTYRARHSGIVNVPRPSSFFGKWMRKVFVPREDWVLVGTDAASCQIRMLAARMDDPEYTDVVLNSDPHSFHNEKADLRNRDKAKEFFYAMVFGASDKKLGLILRVSKAQGKAKRGKLMEGIPAMDRVIKGLKDEWGESATYAWNSRFHRAELANGFIRGLDGRKIFVGSPHTLLVSAVQADEAILMTAAFNVLHKRLENEGLTYGEDYATVLWYHDEIQIECKKEYAELIGRIACDTIRWAGEFLKLRCPQQGDFKVGKDWSETH